MSKSPKRRHKRSKGEMAAAKFTFGALRADQSAWLASTSDDVQEGSESVMTFDMSHKKGQGFRILTANNASADHPSSYLIKETSVPNPRGK